MTERWRVCGTCGRDVLVSDPRAGCKQAFCSKTCYNARPIGASREHVDMLKALTFEELSDYCTLLLIPHMSPEDRVAARSNLYSRTGGLAA